MNFYKFLNKYKYHVLSIIVIFITLTFLHSALLKDVVYESDDYFLHATRTGNYYLALKQGQIPVRWGPNLNQSYGYPSFNYTYHTPYISGSILHMIGFSVQESLNLSVLLATIFGSIFAYFLANSYFKSTSTSNFLSKISSSSWSVLLGLFFTVNPYALLNIYWRGAVGEIFFYALVPLFLLAIRKKYYLIIILTTAGLVLSHLPSMLLLLPLTFIFYLSEIISNSKENFTSTTLKKIILKNRRELLNIVLAGVTGLLLSSWYWVPAIFEQWMIEYKNSNSLSQYSSQFTPILSIFDIRKNFYSNNNFSKVLNIGGVSFLSMLIGFYASKFNKKIIYWLALISTSSFFLSKYSLYIWDNFKALQYVQYPWRFIWLITVSCFMILIYFINEKNIAGNTKKIAFILISIGLIFSTRSYITVKSFTQRSDFDWYHPVLSTGSSFNEHNPIWAESDHYFPEELMYINATEASKLTSTNEEALVHKLSELNATIIQFDGKTISYNINPDQDIITLHKRLFYPGWEAYLDEQPVEFIINLPEYSGILAINVPAKESVVKVTFSGYTLIRRISEIVSVITLILAVGYKIVIVYKKFKG